MIYENVELSGSLDISGSFQVPFGVSGSEPTSPSTGSLFFNTTNEKLYVWEGSWEIVGTQVQPPPSADIEYLVVAGGGGGGGGGWGAGGGGAGGMLSSSLSSIESGSSITVTVGAGGTGRGGGNTFTAGGDGGTSSIASSTGTTFTTVSTVGGGGGGAESANSGLGRDGGSGGGSTQQNASGGSGTAGQGNDGGTGGTVTSPGYPGGGGGGKGSVGSNASGNNGGDGGTGQASSITGTSTNYAGGGGGGTRTSGAQGSGGSSVGGDGANSSTAATSATANRGGGGGGAAGNSSANASNGGSGVVILAYDSGSISATGGKITSRTDGNLVHTFKTSGTFTVGAVGDYPTSQIPTTNLVLWLDPTDTNSYAGSGTTITNLGSGPNASMLNGTGYTSNYWTLDGTNDYIQSVDDGSYDIATSADITMIVWVKVQTSGQYAHFMAWDQQSTAAFKAAPSSYSYQIYWYTPAYSTYNNLSTTFTHSFNNWNQLAMVRRSGVWEAYRNGSLVGNDSDAGDTAGFSCTNLNLGWGWGSEYTAQQRGPMLLYNGTALTADEISLNYDHYKADYGLS